MQNITSTWAREIQQHASIREAMRKEREDWIKERTLERAQWEAERSKERTDWEKERIQWRAERRERERLQEEQMRLELEKQRRESEKEKEDEEKKKAGLRWQDPQADEHCLRDFGGGVHGTWIVDWDEGGCQSFFQDFSDKGCSAQGSGKRRIESELQNIRYGDDGMKMCSSTPTDFHDLHFEGPHSCVYWDKYGHWGYWGLWFIEDGSCT
ncbi:hypothetical protein H1R20_g7164, partial [Candolleomyces eurysporus]